jgi:hypothetical protein
MTTPRPFYIIGHNTNTIAEVRACLQAGGNALEPDVNVYSHDPGRLCISHGRGGEDAPSLEAFLDELHNIAAVTPTLALVVFDCKPPAATAEFGRRLLDTVRSRLTADLSDLAAIVSIAHPAHEHGRIFDLIGADLRPREGCMIDAEDDPDGVADFFRGRRIVNSGYGNGISALNLWLGRRYRQYVERACVLRAQTGDPRFIYVWTVNHDADLREYVRIGVDGIITDDVSGLRAVVADPSLGVRLATRGDNPFRPAVAAYGLTVRTGDRAGAGTDAQVTFTVHGDAGTATKTVDADLVNRFERDSQTSVTIPADDLGALRTVTVRRDDGGNAPDWWLEHVYVAGHAYGRAGVAGFHQWIDTTDPVTRTITAMTGGIAVSSCLFPVIGHIGDRWQLWGAERGPFGCPTGPEEDTPGQRGRRQRFTGGEIGWHIDQQMVTSVFLLEGDAHFEWSLLDSSLLHYDYFRVDIGLRPDPAQAITWLGYAAGQQVFDDQEDGWQRHGRFRFRLNRPGLYECKVKGCDSDGADECRQDWTGTVRVTVDATGPTGPGQPAVTGLIARKWAALGGAAGPLGAPTGEAAAPVVDPAAVSQRFERGVVTVYPAIGPDVAAVCYQRGGVVTTEWGDAPVVNPGLLPAGWLFTATAVGADRPTAAQLDTANLDHWAVNGDGARRHVFFGLPAGDYTLTAATPYGDLSAPMTVVPMPGDIHLSEVPPDASPANAFVTRAARAGDAATWYITAVPLLWEIPGGIPTGEDQTYQLLAHLHAMATSGGAYRAPGQAPSGAQVAMLLRALVRGEVGTDKDYDMALKGLVTAICRYRGLLTDAQVDRVLADLVPPDLNPYTEFPAGPVWIPETENHILMIWSSLFLVNQLRHAATGDARYDNLSNGLTGKLLDYLSTIARHDFLEFNSRSYARLSTHALLNLYEFANDFSLRTAAQLLLDYAMVKFAVSSTRGRHVGPFRRLREKKSRPDVKTTNDLLGKDTHPLTAFSLIHAGPIGAAGNPVDHLPGQWGAEYLFFGPTAYDIPQAAYVLGLTAHPPVQHVFSHGHRPRLPGTPPPENPDGGVEIYYRTPTFLLSAGGLFLNSGYGHDDLPPSNYKQVAVAQSTTLVPVRADLTFDELIRFDWALYTDDIDDERQGVNTAVHLGFACGANLHLPPWLFDGETVPAGPWIFVNLNRTRPDRPGRGRLGIHLAVYRTPTEGAETAWGDNLGLIHAVVATESDEARDAAAFAAFEQTTRDNNRHLAGPLHVSGEYEFHTADGHHLTGVIAPTSARYTNRIKMYDGVEQPADLGELPLVDGRVLTPGDPTRDGPYLRASGGHDGYIEIRHPGCPAPLVLDYRNRQYPRRIQDGACEQHWRLERAQASSNLAMHHHVTGYGLVWSGHPEEGQAELARQREQAQRAADIIESIVDALPDPTVAPDDVLGLAKLLYQLIGLLTHGSPDMTPGVKAAEYARRAYEFLDGDHRIDIAQVWVALAQRHHETGYWHGYGSGNPDLGASELASQRDAAQHAADIAEPMVDALPDPSVGPDDVLRLAKMLAQLIGFLTHGSPDTAPGVKAAEYARKAYAHLPGDHSLDIAEVWTGLALRHHETSAMAGHPDPQAEGSRQRAAAVQAAHIVFPIAHALPDPRVPAADLTRIADLLGRLVLFLAPAPPADTAEAVELQRLSDEAAVLQAKVRALG